MISSSGAIKQIVVEIHLGRFVRYRIYWGQMSSTINRTNSNMSNVNESTYICVLGEKKTNTYVVFYQLNYTMTTRDTGRHLNYPFLTGGGVGLNTSVKFDTSLINYPIKLVPSCVNTKFIEGDLKYMEKGRCELRMVLLYGWLLACICKYTPIHCDHQIHRGARIYH